MAALSEEDRVAVWGGAMRRADISFGEITKADLRAAVDAVNDWIDANAASYNSAIPQPARANLSARQKAALLSAVIAMRFGRA